MGYFCKVCGYGFNELNSEAGYSNTLCSRQCKTASDKIASLEAERDRAVELLTMSLHSGVGVQDYQLREHIESFLASIGGEVKP